MTRRVVAGILVAALVVLSGCSGALSGPVTFAASQATVSDAALEATGYEHDRTDELTITEEVSAAGQTKEVEVTNWVSEYHQQVGIDGVAAQRAAVFTTFSSPKVSVLGKSFNPLAEFDNRELAEQFTGQLDDVSNVREVGTREVTMLGETTEVTKFEATVTTTLGVQFDAHLHVAKVEHGDDVVVALGVYPEQLPGQQEKIDRLIRGVEHDAE